MSPKTYMIILTGASCCLLFFLHHSANLADLWLERGTTSHSFQSPRKKLSVKLEKLFHSFFEDEEVREFRREYTQRCSKSSTTGTLTAVLNGRSSGLGSVLNNALNVVLIAWEPSVSRHFTLVESPTSWSYTSLSVFFDQRPDLPCPLLVGITSDSSFSDVSENFTLHMDFDTQKVKFIGRKHETIRYFGVKWPHFRNVSEEILNRDGREKVFRRKSALTRTLWNFKPEYGALLKELWSKVVDDNGRFFAVHIRRTDKLRSKEMKNVPVARYWLKVASICYEHKTSCPNHVFVMYDDVAAFRRLKKCALHANSSIEFLDYAMLVNMTGRTAAEFTSVVHPAPTSEYAQREWFKHTQEMLLSITLLAMSDQLICTFSSNVCRLAALVRGNLDSKSLHSLDDPMWHNM